MKLGCSRCRPWTPARVRENGPGEGTDRAWRPGTTLALAAAPNVGVVVSHRQREGREAPSHETAPLADPPF